MVKRVISKKEYVIEQIKKTNKKNYENYVVTGIIHGVKSLDLEFRTQQFVQKEDGKYYLTDLYFPQLDLHLEVNEDQHNNSIPEDELRAQDIRDATGHEIRKILIYDVDPTDKKKIKAEDTLERVDKEISKFVNYILKEVKSRDDLGNLDWFQKYNDPEKYFRNIGELKVDDNPTFRIGAQIANLLGQGYKPNAQILWVSNLKKYPRFSMWCPKIHNPHDNWENSFCLIEGEKVLIQNCNKTDINKQEQFNKQLNTDDTHFPRITFPYLKDNLGIYGYKFKGVYEIDRANSSIDRGVVYRRTETTLKLTNTL